MCHRDSNSQPLWHESPPHNHQTRPGLPTQLKVIISFILSSSSTVMIANWFAAIKMQVLISKGNYKKLGREPENIYF